MMWMVFSTLLGFILAQEQNSQVAGFPTTDIWTHLHAPIRQYRWNEFYSSHPKEFENIVALENKINEHLEKSRKVIGTAEEREKQGTQNFCNIYQRFLMNMCSAMDDVRKMAEERQVACVGNQQELKDLYNLLSQCAKARVQLQKEISVYSEALKRAMKITRKEVKPEANLLKPVMKIPVNGTSPSIKDNLAINSTKSQAPFIKAETKTVDKKSLPVSNSTITNTTNVKNSTLVMPENGVSFKLVNATATEPKQGKMLNYFQVGNNTSFPVIKNK